MTADTIAVPVQTSDRGFSSTRSDSLAIEEPLQLCLNGSPLSITMRTPGYDLDLAAGFLFTEGIIDDVGQILSMRAEPAEDEDSGDKVSQAQDNFKQTGGIHAAALFSREGALLGLREDVGRHNAVDKLIGFALRDGSVPLGDSLILVSGRAGFELVQKSVMAAIPILAAVGAPSSLAVELAQRFGMTLVGFLRGERFNIYSGSERIQ